MKRYQEKRNLKKIFFSRFFIMALLALFIILSFSTAKVYSKFKKAYDKNRETIAKIEELEQRKKELEARISALSSEAGKEEEIREKFNIKKPGEEVLTIIDKSPGSDKINNKNDDGFFPGIWNWLENLW